MQWALGTLQYKFHLPYPKFVLVRPRPLTHAVKLRAATSDSFVFRQIMIENEYAPLSNLAPATIVDLGANIGLASVWFLNRFPQASVFAVEAEASNYNACRQNLSAYQGRARVLHGAAWSCPTKLSLRRHNCQADNTVHEASGDKTLDGWDIKSLIKMSGFERVGLLKIDIEGSERALFRENYDAWLPLIDALCIELHGNECREIFFNALRFHRYEHLRSGELDILLNLKPKGAGVTDHAWERSSEG